MAGKRPEDDWFKEVEDGNTPRAPIPRYGAPPGGDLSFFGPGPSPAEPTSRVATGLGGGVRRPPNLGGGEGDSLTEEHLEMLEREFESVSPTKLPGMAHTPGKAGAGGGGAGWGGERKLFRPAFGAVLSRDEFQGEMEEDLTRTFGNAKGIPLAAGPDDAEDGIVAFATDETARADLQNGQLAKAEERLSGLKDKGKELERELKAAADVNKQLRSEVKRLKTDALNAEERVEDLRREGEATGKVKAANKDEEKKFRELEARMKREEAKRKAQELGLEEEEEAFVLPGDRFGIGIRIQGAIKAYKNFVHRFDGMHSECKRAESRFGSGISLYFWFFRWMTLMLALLSLVWVSYFVVHIVDLLFKGYSFKMVGIIFPNYLLYSSFPNDWAISYAALISGSLMVVLIAAVFKFINEFKIKHKADVYYLDGEPARYGKIAFNMWNYNTFKEEEVKETSDRVASLFKVLKSEDTTAERVAARTQAEWTRLYIKRTIGISFNFLVILAGWAGIILSKFFLGGGSGTGILDLFLRNLPTVLPTLINGVLPQVIDFAVNIEAWDDPSTALKMRVARLYAAKILNALIQVVAVLIFYRGPIALFGNTRVLTRDCGYVTCEDQIGTTLFTLFITDVIIGTLATIGVASAQKAVFTTLSMPTLAYGEFKPPVQIIKVLYQQILLWFTLPHFPAVLPIALLLWFIQFRVDIFVLFKFNAKKVTPFDARDSGIYFAMFYAATLFIFGAWMYYVFFVLTSSILDLECCRLPEIIPLQSTGQVCLASAEATRNGATVANGYLICQEDALAANGVTSQPVTPFASLSMSKTLSTAMSVDSSSSWLLGLVDSALLGYFFATVMFLLFLYEQMKVKILEEFLDEAIDEISKNIDALTSHQKNKQRRIDLITRKDEDDDEDGLGMVEGEGGGGDGAT